MNLFKNNLKRYILLKSKFNPKLYSQNLKIFEAIKDLDLIDLNLYSQIHSDCKNIHPAIHYIFHGKYDLNKPYINDLFDLEFYKNKYGLDNTEDPLIHYVLNGFKEGNLVNLDYGDFINSLEEPIAIQYLKNNSYLTNQENLASYLVSNDTLECDEVKIGVFFNDSFENLAPCPYIRIHSLFKQLSKESNYKFFIYGANSYNLIDISQILKNKQFDIIVVQRILPFLDILLEKAKKHNIKLIYETDDDLLGVEENSPSFEYVDRVRANLTSFIDNSDLITVSTPELAKKFQNKDVEIIKNYYVNEVFDIKDKIANNSKLKLGYFGTLTHSKDLFLIKEAILKLKEKYDFDFEIIGGFNADDNVCDGWFKSISLPENNMDFASFMGWLQENSNWDIGIVPLEDSKFNKGKSELKYIELAILGVPSVFSDICVYNSVISNGVNGFLALNTDDWVKNIEKLILDVDLRDNIRQNALKDVLTNYSKDERVNKWKNIFDSMINQ